MGTFDYGSTSHLYQPWQTTFDASGIVREGIAGHIFWFGQLTDGNSFTLDQAGANIVAMTISDGVNDIITAQLSLPAAPLTAMLGNSNFTNADWVNYLMSGPDTVNGSAAGDHLFGGAGNDLVLGGAAADTLGGGAGNDTLNGGSGTDTVTFEAASHGVSVDLATGVADGEGHDQLISIERVVGSAFDDTLAGGSGPDTLTAGAGDDILVSSAGNDILDGGAGRDTVSYASAAGPVTVDLSSHSATGDGADTLISIENIVGSAFGDLLTGDSSSNLISGGAGDDTLLGGGGADTLAGGLGNDVLDGGAGSNTASYALAMYGVNADLSTGHATGEGDDTLLNISNLIGSNQADTLTGDAGKNVLIGGAGDDTLNGGDGADTLAGGFGNDVLNGGAGNDTASFAASVAPVHVDLSAGTAVGEGSDTLISIEAVIGSAFGDTLVGSAGADTLDGGGGNDVLQGAGGKDVLTGGAGADRFVFTATSDSHGAARDQITDFSHAQGDVIDLSAIDANTTLAGDQAFHLGGAVFTHSAGELIQYASGASTIVAGDVNGDGVADFSVQLANGAVLVPGDIVL